MHVFFYVFKLELLASHQYIFHYNCKYIIYYKLTRSLNTHQIRLFVKSERGIGFNISLLVYYYGFILIGVYKLICQYLAL